MARSPEQIALARTSKRMLSAVRRILWETWDPIGVNDHADASTEYDSYAPAIVGMLLQDCTAHDLERHLSTLETDSMGLAPRSTTAARDATVAALLHLPRR